jgi:hypothetical protein
MHPRPNLKYRAFRNALVFVGKWSWEGIRDPESEEEFKAAEQAVVLKFENDTWKDGIGATAGSVLGKITYHSSNDRDPLLVDYAVWLGSSTRLEHFKVGDTRELVICLQAKNGDVCVMNDKRRSYNETFSEFFWARMEAVTNLKSVDVTLVDIESHAKYDFEFEVNRNETAYLVTLTKSTLPESRLLEQHE